MKTAGPVQLVFVLLTITWVFSMPPTETSSRRQTQPQVEETAKQIMNFDTSSNITLDTRTPPKIKQHQKNPPKKEETLLENFHPGIAIPVEEIDLDLEESTKNFNFYKIENRPTTDQGLSTWVLLNSQTVSPSSSTTKTTRKPVIKQKIEYNKNLTATDAEIFNKMTKPLFKKRPLSTTKKPTVNTITESLYPEKLTKVKASILNNAINNKNKTTVPNFRKKPTETTTPLNKKVSEELFEASTSNPTSSKSTTPLSITNDSSLIPMEAKDDNDNDIDLSTTTSPVKKSRRPTTKKKKNKNRKRRPNLEKSETNSTKLTNKIQKEKPISTQIYNYLSREIMPTVGVGLVGLVVTAGLASYFLYPYGIARRSYEVDRKDKENGYYYTDEYAPDGIAEEEAIGKVIAGMPATSNDYQTQRSPSSRDAYSNLQLNGFRKSQLQPSSDAIYLTPSRRYTDHMDSYFPQRKINSDFYSPDIIEHSQETGYTVSDNKFVVGNTPIDLQEITPVIVPEHGPRNLPELTTKTYPDGVTDYIFNRSPEIITKRSRKRRSNDFENEIPYDDHLIRNSVTKISGITEISTVKSTEIGLDKEPSFSFMTSLQRLFETKVRFGLELLKTVSETISKYFLEVQRRFNKNMSKEQPRIS